MKLPKKVNLMGEEFRIKKIRNHKWVAMMLPFDRIIKINSNATEKLQMESLLHEMIEYILYRLSCSSDNNKKKIRYFNMQHSISPRPTENDTYEIFINVLTDTLVRNQLIK